MCGIIAIYKTSERSLDPTIVEGMTSALTHRGREDYGYAFATNGSGFTWRDETPTSLQAKGVAMGHRRMAIFDLSTKGRQPFVTPDGRYWMVFNGEIYNFWEIRDDLKALGHSFTSESDTEVLLAAFAEWGKACFKRFNGNWAVAIWDAKEERLVVCRDRIGLKPLYYCEVGGDWVFGSEIKALLKHPGITAKPDMPAIFDHLSRNSFPNGKETLYEGIFSVEPGTMITFQKGQVQTERHWAPPETTQPPIDNDDEAVEQYLYLLKDAVKLCLRSDIRVGTTLSGGLDSTSVIATVNEVLQSDNRSRETVGDDLQAFSASFPGEQFDETKLTDELCGFLNIVGHKIYPNDADNVAEAAHDAVHAMEMPFNSGIPIVNTLLLRRARGEGVPIVLNGYGPDESLGGFPGSHCSMAAADALRRLRLDQCFGELKGMVELHGHSWKGATAVTLEHTLPARKVSFLTGKNLNETDHLFRNDWLVGRAANSWFEEYRTGLGRSELEQRLRWEFFEGLVPRWIQMEDRISMASSVVTRQPFFDYRLVEFAFSLGNRLKIRNGYTKFIMRKAMRGRLPDAIVNNPRKFFFPGPNIHWLKGALRPLLQSSLTEGDPMIGTFIDPSNLRSLVSDFLGGDHRQSIFLWRLLNTELWMRSYFR